MEFAEKIRKLDEEIESEEDHAQKDQEGAQGETALRELHHGVNETGRNYDQARLATTFIERAGWNIARQISAEKRNFALDPNGKFLAVTPEIMAPVRKTKYPRQVKRPRDGPEPQ